MVEKLKGKGKDAGGAWILGLLAIVGVVALGYLIYQAALLPGEPVPTIDGAPVHGPFGPEGPEEVVPREAWTDVDRDQPLLGGWLGAWPTDDNELLTEYEEKTGHRAELVDIYVDWTTPYEDLNWTLQWTIAHGSVPQITWEPHGYTTPEIVDGNKSLKLQGGQTVTVDAYIESYAKGVCWVAKQSDQTVLIRPMHEMNGGWYSWGTSYQLQDGSHPNSDESFQKAWRKIHDAVRGQCSSDHVRFVWNPNHYSKGERSSVMGTYPGDQYVDYVGLDGYNWGSQASWPPSSFDGLFKGAYCTITAELNKPILISEYATAEEGVDKAAWIREALDGVREGKYPQVVGMMYFDNSKDEVEVDGTVRWAIDSSPEAQEAYREASARLQQQGVGQGPSICQR